jgi:dihydroorotate dehydrogenase
MYKALLRPLLFRMDPETAHHLVFSLLGLLFRIPGMRVFVSWMYRVKNSPVKKMGLTFPNPIGLAAGFDKDGLLYRELSAFGFGFIEAGTVTPRPQPGNPRPRMFRLPADQGLINRMGFNNAGVEALAERLKHKPKSIIVGGNIGKNKDTPNDRAVEDYLQCFDILFPLVDYFVVNVSSPNTPGLRELQDKGPLLQLLSTLMEANRTRLQPKPVLLKIAPDLSNEQLTEIIEIVQSTGLDGVIATNTTVAREGLKTSGNAAREVGGLSGKPLTGRSTEVIRFLRKGLGAGPVIIGVGGVFDAKDAREKLSAGADLLQVYTGFIYEGPGIIGKIMSGL